MPHALAELFSEWRPDGFDALPELEAVFSAGHSNRSFLVRFGGLRVVARLPDGNGRQLGVDRHVEQRVLERAARIGLGAPVLYCNPARGMLVTEYLESRPLRVDGVAADQSIDRLASALHLLHRQDLDVPVLNIVDRVRAYARELQSDDPYGWPRARRWLSSTRQVLEQYRFGRWHAALCHNDLVAQNLLEVDGSVRFIDWEYAARGDAFFDLATIAEECGFGALDRRRLLLAYGEIGDAAIERLYRGRVLYRLLGVLWYLLRYRGAQLRTVPALARHEQALEALLRQEPE
jgi:thiamine kinase-like enzyme